jgi:DUF1016 N-terminal domain
MNDKISLNDQGVDNLFIKVSQIIDQGKGEAMEAIYNAMTKSYYLIGQSIIEEEQSGNHRAKYGKNVLENLSNKLKVKYGRGYSVRNLREIRSFYLEVGKRRTLSAELKFPLAYSLYQIIFDLTEPQQSFYENLSIKERFSVRELEQAIKSSTYERFLSKDTSVLTEVREK